MALIAVTHCNKLEDYRQSVLHVGGDVRIVDPSMTVAAALDGANGLLLTGGGDVAPARYGETPHESVVDVDPARDTFEIELLQEARRRGVPVFGICRGIQVMNVALGGTLVQDIPSQIPGALPHKLTVPPHASFEHAHDVWIEENSLLARVMQERLAGSDSCSVNSRHHQAIRTLAPGLRAVATAPDGIIEAVEDPSARFCLGVQWHPENYWRTGEFRPIFEGFLEAASQ